jgi:hypothetical protein
MKKTTERFNRWKAKKVAMGFRHVQLFAPEPMIADLKKYISQWKTDHLEYWERK